MLDAATVELLESGCAPIVGLATADRKPYATRGWGLTVLEGGQRARLLVGADEFSRLGYPSDSVEGTTIATTGCSVRTLRSVQLKGAIHIVESADAADRERMARYCDAYYDDVAETDALPRVLMEQLEPADLVACEFAIAEIYDQTPGAGAGGALRSHPS